MVPVRSKTAHVSQFSGTLLVCHLERSEAPAERSRKTPLLFRSPEKLITISTTGRHDADRRDSRGCEKSLFDNRNSQRLKPRPFKTRSKPQFFGNLSSRSLVTAALVSMCRSSL